MPDFKTYSFSAAYKIIIGSWCGFWRFGKLAATELSTLRLAEMFTIEKSLDGNSKAISELFVRSI
jgi:hypothetical protein